MSDLDLRYSLRPVSPVTYGNYGICCKLVIHRMYFYCIVRIMHNVNCYLSVGRSKHENALQTKHVTSQDV